MESRRTRPHAKRGAATWDHPTSPLDQGPRRLRVIEHRQQELPDHRMVGLRPLLPGVVAPPELVRRRATRNAIDHAQRRHRRWRRSVISDWQF